MIGARPRTVVGYRREMKTGAADLTPTEAAPVSKASDEGL